ncbi:6206_t:CDS:2, partial [Acaulospora colombiana]
MVVTVYLIGGGLRTFAYLLLELGRNIPHLWAYAIISQIVAVSTALSLFCIAVTLQSPRAKHIPSKKNDDEINAVLLSAEEETEAPAQLSVPVLLGLFLVSACPAPTSPDFLPIILSLHAVLLIPTLPNALWTSQPNFLRLPVMTVYFAVTALSLVLRIQSTLAAVISLEYIGIMEFAQAAWQ